MAIGYTVFLIRIGLDCGHLRFGKLPCPHIRKNAICNLSARFEGQLFYPLNPKQKEPERLFCFSFSLSLRRGHVLRNEATPLVIDKHTPWCQIRNFFNLYNIAHLLFASNFCIIYSRMRTCEV